MNNSNHNPASVSGVPARHHAVFNRLLAIFTAALTGYVWGWIWGWSLFDPNLDVWALAAAALSLAGLLAGLFGGPEGLFQKHASVWLGATGGLFLGWYARTLIFGDHPGGWGVLLLLAGAVGGGWLARKRAWPQPVLLAALYSGFFGGFLINVVLLDWALGLVPVHSIQGQAPWVIACACLGAWWAARRSPVARPA